MLSMIESIINELQYDALGRRQRTIKTLFPPFDTRVKKIGKMGGLRLQSLEDDTMHFKVHSGTQDDLWYDNFFKFVGINRALRKFVPDTRLWTKNKDRINYSRLAHKVLHEVDVQISCSCPSFLFYGQDYIVSRPKYDAKYGDPETRPPKIKNPQQHGSMCKHLQNVYNVIPWYENSLAQYLKSEYFDVISGLEKQVIDKREAGKKKQAKPKEIPAKKKPKKEKSKMKNKKPSKKTMSTLDVKRLAKRKKGRNMRTRESIFEQNDHKFSCLMVRLGGSQAAWIKNYAKRNIPKENLYLPEGGVVDDPHITVKYGLHTDDWIDVLPYVHDVIPNARFGSVEIFEANGYDVVYAAVNSPDLILVNQKIEEGLSHEKTYEYKPHATIAYVKKGTANELKNDTEFARSPISLKEWVFSNTDSGKKSIKFNEYKRMNSMDKAAKHRVAKTRQAKRGLGIQEGMKQVKQKYLDSDKVSEIDFRRFASVDPTRTKKYLDWMLDKFVKEEVTDYIEFERLLREFDEAVEKNLISNKDIYSYRTFEDLVQAVHLVVGKKTKTQTSKDLRKEVDIIQETDTFFIVSPRTEEASKKYGAGTKWCTSANVNNAFDNYNNRGVKLYYIIDKRDNAKYAVAVQPNGNKEVYDEQDRSMDFDDLMKKLNRA